MPRPATGFSITEWEAFQKEWDRIRAKVIRLYGYERLNKILFICCSKEVKDESTG